MAGGPIAPLAFFISYMHKDLEHLQICYRLVSSRCSEEMVSGWSSYGG